MRWYLRSRHNDATITTTMMFRAAAIDLDGTLLNSNHELSEASVSYLQELNRKGFTIIVATGRGASTVYRYVDQLGFAMPIVCSNGARGLLYTATGKTTSLLSKKELFLTSLPINVVQSSVEVAKELGLVIQYYLGDQIYANPSNEEQMELTQRSSSVTKSSTVYVKDDFASIMKEKEPPSKVLIMCYTTQQLDELEGLCRQRIGDGAHLIKAQSTVKVNGKAYYCILEVLHPDVHKGHGLQRMCTELGIDMKECLAFGDGANDLEFIEMAGRGIVMKNGVDKVKAVGDEVLNLTNDEVRFAFCGVGVLLACLLC